MASPWCETQTYLGRQDCSCSIITNTSTSITNTSTSSTRINQPKCQTINYWSVLAGKLVFISGRLLVAGMFVFITGTLLMADILVVPPIVLLAPLILELVAEVSVELLGLFWLQPTSASAARTVIADRVIIDFISSLLHFSCH